MERLELLRHIGAHRLRILQLGDRKGVTQEAVPLPKAGFAPKYQLRLPAILHCSIPKIERWKLLDSYGRIQQ